MGSGVCVGLASHWPSSSCITVSGWHFFLGLCPVHVCVIISGISTLTLFIPTIRLVAPCRAIPLPARFVSGFGERASVPRLGFGLGRIWVSRVSLPLSFYYSCVYLQYIVIVIVSTVAHQSAGKRAAWAEWRGAGGARDARE